MDKVKLVGIWKNARSFLNFPALMVLVLVGVFGAIVWNQQVAQEKSAKEDKANEKKHEKIGMLLVEASCNKKKMFRQLLVQNNIGQQYAFANFDAIYDAAKAKNKKNCSLLTRPVALPGIGGSDSFTNTTENTPDGWESTSKQGVYQKWCNTGECDTGKVTEGQRYSVLMLWCKEAPCGDIYGQVNLYNGSGVVVGYTNDTGYGDKGEKVLLTFSSYQDFSSMRLTELNLR